MRAAVATLLLVLLSASASARQSFDRGLTIFAPRPLPGEPLAEFTTRFKAEHQNRSHNVRQAALRLLGVTLLPGQALSYNRVVGPRDEHLGFRMAPAIDRGKYVDQSGGGVCQPSSTLHAAAVIGGLEITERYAHTWTPVYIAAGFDAAVSYGVRDLKLRNPHPFAVRIAVDADNDRVTVRLFSDAPRSAWNQLETTVRNVRPFKTIVESDPNMGPGTERLELYGLEGMTVDRAVVTGRPGRSLARRHVDGDLYVPRDAIIMAGVPIDTESALAEPLGR